MTSREYLGDGTIIVEFDTGTRLLVPPTLGTWLWVRALGLVLRFQPRPWTGINMGEPIDKLGKSPNL